MKLKVFVTLAAVSLASVSLLSEQAGATPNLPFGRFGDEEKKPEKKKEAPKETPKESTKPSKDAAKPGDKAAAAKEKKKEPEKIEAGTITKKIALAPKGIQWGMTLEAVAKLYDRIFDEEFLPLYKKAEPGTAQQALDTELSEKKALMRRNKVEFGKLPTGVDNGPLKGEYSYNNGESMSSVTLKSGTKRYVFFFNDKLWKIYDEHKLRQGGPLGENFKEAVGILTKKFGGTPVVLQADFAKGRSFEEAVWKDSSTIIRAVNREPVLGMVYVDRSVQENLPSLRRNKPVDPHAMDREVSDVTAKPPPETPKPEEKGKDKGKKGAPAPAAAKKK